MTIDNLLLIFSEYYFLWDHILGIMCNYIDRVKAILMFFSCFLKMHGQSQIHYVAWFKIFGLNYTKCLRYNKWPKVFICLSFFFIFEVNNLWPCMHLLVPWTKKFLHLNKDIIALNLLSLIPSQTICHFANCFQDVFYCETFINVVICSFIYPTSSSYLPGFTLKEWMTQELN